MFGVVKSPCVVQAHDAAKHRAAFVVFGQPVHRPALVAWREQGRVDRQHGAGLVQLVDGLPVGLALHSTDAKATKHSLRRAIVAEPQAQGV
ncbi:hypothetical protein D9M71_641030 [compost metagenome]